MRKINIPVETDSPSILEDIEIIESVQLLVKNLTVDNLKLLAEKSIQPNVNKKIQTYKKFF